MLPAIFTTAMPERATVTPSCKVAGSQSSRFCKSKTSVKRFYCKICLLEYSVKKGQMLESCACIFCKECVQQYVSHSINNGSVLGMSCPDALCPKNGQLLKAEISLLVSDQMFQKYITLVKKKEVAVDKSKAFCPMAGCDGVCNGVPGAAQSTVCKECGYMFCFDCKESWHMGMTCEEYRATISDLASGVRFVDILKENGEAGDIKECPLCQVLIMREAGCAQMMCGHCKHIFCWHCSKSLDSDIMLRHYDKGPCRNKLGHSRASLFLHRAQVIAGFAFFGLMILVASPFLLIVSPCLLLSKCMFRK